MKNLRDALARADTTQPQTGNVVRHATADETYWCDVARSCSKQENETRERHREQVAAIEAETNAAIAAMEKATRDELDRIANQRQHALNQLKALFADVPEIAVRTSHD